jgi:hypothetical protein
MLPLPLPMRVPFPGLLTLLALTTTPVLVSGCSSKQQGACYPHTAVQRVPTAPPEPLPEFEPLPPAGGMVWVAGSWDWDGQRWQWLPGHHESPPVPGARWCPPRYTGEPGSAMHGYQPGSFGCAPGGEP